MTGLITHGLNWSVKGRRITIFEHSAIKMASGEYDIPLFNGSTARHASPPHSILKVLEDLIRQNIAACKCDRIDGFGISPIAGLRLFLEGILTKEMLATSIDSPDCITVILEISGSFRKITIWSPRKELPQGIEIYDAVAIPV